MRLFDYLNLGGPIGYAIFFVYILGLVVTFERLIFFFQTRGKFSLFSHFVRSLSVQGTISSAPLKIDHLSKYSASYYYLITDAFLKHNVRDHSLLEQHLTQLAQQSVRKMESLMWILPLIAQLAPLAGLLGTMTGLIQSFRGIEELGGQVNISILAGGIWEAMVTTVIGIIVAIFSMIAFKLLDNIIDNRAQLLDDLICQIVLQDKVRIINSMDQ